MSSEAVPSGSMPARVQVFLGKGGVGKTTCAAATALRLAEEGEHSLVISTDPTPSLSHIFELEGVHRDREVRPGLFLWDTAPLGQTLALLGMPAMLDEHLRTAPRIYSHLRTTGDRRETVIEIIARWRQLAADCMAFLRRDVQFTLVTIPEALSVCQVDGVVRELARYGLRIARLVVNNVVEQSDSAFLTQRMEQQAPHLARLHSRFGDVPVVEIPLFPREVRGISRLHALGHVLCADGQPA
jgi:anion-transporting  ArsA/GET3 family ATPase